MTARRLALWGHLLLCTICQSPSALSISGKGPEDHHPQGRYYLSGGQLSAVTLTWNCMVLFHWAGTMYIRCSSNVRNQGHCWDKNSSRLVNKKDRPTKRKRSEPISKLVLGSVISPWCPYLLFSYIAHFSASFRYRYTAGICTYKEVVPHQCINL